MRGNITTGTISDDELPATITSNITGNVTGDVTGTATTATTATNVTVADESSDTSCFLLYSTKQLVILLQKLDLI